MAEDRIDSIIDRAAITGEVEGLKKQIAEVVALIKQTKGQSIDFNVNTKTISDYNKGIAELNASMQKVQQSAAGLTAAHTQATAATVKNTQATQQANGTLEQNIELRRRLQATLNSYLKDQKEDIALLKSGTITRAEYNKRLTESQAKVAIYKQKISELNRVIKEDIALEGKAGDAYKQLSAEYNRAALAAKNYQITLGATHPTTILATSNAKELNTRLKEIDNSVGQNQRNVGNYAGGITQAFGKLWGFLRTAANVIPGLGIGGLIGGIAIGIGKLATMLFTSNKAFDEGKVFAKAYADTLKEVELETRKNANVDVSKLQLYRDIITDTTAKQQDRIQALQAYNKIADDANKIDESQINNLNLINDKISQQISLIEKRAFSRAAEAIIADRGEKLLLAQLTAREEAEKQFTNEQSMGMKVAGKATDEYFLNLEKQSRISTIVRGKEAVKTAQLEFDAAKNALRNLIQIEGFAADEIKTKKEKTAKKGRDLAEANRKAQFEILKAQIELDKEFDLLRAADEKRSFVDRISNLINYGADSQRLIEEQAKFDLGTANQTSIEKQKIELDKNNALIRLATDLNERLKKIAADNFKVDTNTLPVDSKIPKELQKILDDFSKAQKKAIEDAANNAKKLKEAMKSAFEGLATELTGLFFDVFQNAIERQKNAVQDQIDLLEQQKQKDIEVANQTITNAQDRADAIAVIEARAAAKRQQLELRQRQLDQQKARFEKANAVTRIIQETGIAIMSSFKTDPTGILALVIGAIGAAQLVRVLAQPIPKYAEGTDYHPGGKAVVGDGGRSEGVVMPDGSVYRTPSTSTVIDLPEGAKVFPDYSKMMMNATMTKVPVFNVKTVDNTSATMEKVGRNIVRAVKSIPQPHLTTDGAWSKAMKTGSNFRTYLNKNL